MKRRNFIKNLPSLGVAMALPCVVKAEQKTMYAPEQFWNRVQDIQNEYDTNKRKRLIIPEGCTVTVSEPIDVGPDTDFQIDGKVIYTGNCILPSGKGILTARIQR